MQEENRLHSFEVVLKAENFALRRYDRLNREREVLGRGEISCRVSMVIIINSSSRLHGFTQNRSLFLSLVSSLYQLLLFTSKE
jgi:hypothetical protein